ncbi:MAG TPA: hypothetical protein VKC51_05290 [Lacunisphaera sp.]|nr:hypothetical protein [Lacunisphaera sp.]
MITRNPIRAAIVLALLLITVAHAMAQLGLSITPGTRKSASTSLIVASATEAIRVCAYEARNQMLFDMETRLKATTEAIDGLSAEARILTKGKLQLYESAMQDMKIQAAALRLGMQAAEKATEKTWPQIRAALAFSYIDYVGVVTRAEGIVAGREL